MERFGLNYKMLEQHNVHFADSFILCKKVRKNSYAFGQHTYIHSHIKIQNNVLVTVFRFLNKKILGL